MPLGKSLGNILGDYFGDEAVTMNHTAATSEAREIPIKSIKQSPYQTRTHFDFEKIQSLAKSIADHGLIHPIVVVSYQNEDGSEQFTLLAGERRLRACKLLDRTSILAIVKPAETITPEYQAIITAMENLQREDLSPIEQARTFEMLLNTQKISEEELAKMLESSVQYVKNYLRLLTLSEPVKQALMERKIGEGQARHLVGLPENQQIELLHTILTQDLTVKEIVHLLKKSKLTEAAPKSAMINIHSVPRDAVTRAQKIAELLPKSKLKCTGNDKKGKIIISWG